MKTHLCLAVLLAAGCARGPSKADTAGTLEELTVRLESLNGQYWSGGQRFELVPRLVAVATRRAELFEEIARTDPARALKTTVSNATRVSLPEGARRLVEAPFDSSGRINLEITDRSDGTATTAPLLVGAGSGPLRLFSTPIPGRRIPWPQASSVAIRGWALNDFVLVASADQQGAPLAAIPWTNEKILAIVINFSDVTNALSASQVQSLVFGATGSAKAYYSGVSNGTANLTGDVIGPFTVSIPQTCNAATIRAVALQAAAAAGADLGAYGHHLISVPVNNNCTYVGIATATLPPTNAIIAGNSVDFLQIAIHELGHNLGLLHAHSLLCPGTSLVADESTCSFTEYGHEVDEMAHGSGSFNPFGLQFVGWLNRGTFGDTAEVVSTGSYTLSPLTVFGGLPRALKVPYGKAANGTSRSFFVEYRQPIGVDAYLSAAPNSQRVFITLGNEEDSDSSDMLYLDFAGGWAGMPAGGTFTAPNGLTMTLTAASAASATLSITMPADGVGCIRSAPSLYPVFQEIGPSYNAGSTGVYALSLHNNDSSACAASKFDLAITGLPSGWSSDTTGSVVAVPGSTVKVPFYVTSSVTAPLGATAFTVSVSDVLNAGHTASTTGSYNVTACVPVTPTLTAIPTSNSGAAGTTLNYLLSVTNNNPATCGDMSFNLSNPIFPASGWSVNLSPITVSSGQTGTTPMTITVPVGTAAGTYLAGSDAMFTTSITTNVTGLTQLVYQHQKVVTQVVVGAACTRLPAQVVVSPSTQSGTGSAKTYTVTVTNMEGANCSGTTTTTLTATPPAGWGASLTTSSFTLAPGASGTSTLTVTPAGGASVGNYNTTLTATNAYGTVTTAATYKVYCTLNVAPQLSFSPSPGSGAAGETVTYSVGVKNISAAGCGVTTYSLTSSMFSSNGTTGWTLSLGSTQVSAAVGETAYTTIAVTPPSNAPAYWLYRFEVDASDSLGNTRQGLVTHIVPCVRAVPTVTINPTLATIPAGTSAPITVTVKSNALVGCVAEDFTLSSVLPAGWTSTQTNNPVSLVGGQTDTSTWSVRAGNGATEGSYSPTVTATSPDSFAATATLSATVPCTSRSAPTVTLDPDPQSGAAGSALAYTVNVTNNDASNCLAQTFNLSQSIPATWVGSLSPSSLSLVGRATGTSTFTVTSPVGATGSSTVTVTATGATSGAGSGSATYDIPCTRNAHTISLTPASQSSAPGGALAYTVTVTNNDVGCTANVYTLSSTAPSGWGKSLTLASLTVAAGAVGSTTYTVTSTAGALGTNSISVSAVPTNGSSTSKTGTASYVVTCTRTAPTVSLSPSSQSGLAGTLKAYTVSVTNNDVGCSSGVFTLTKSAPGGWTNTLVSSSLTLASGATGTTTFNVTSSGSAAANTYTVSVTATNANSGANTGSASDVVTPGCARAAPTVSISPSSLSGVPGAALAYTFNVTNNDTNCAAGTYNLTNVVPSGWSGVLAPTSLSLASGASSSATFTVTSSASANGTFSVSATAANGASGSSTGNASAVVSPSCARVAPTVTVSPASQNGNAGAALNYTVSVTNNDSACGSGVFALSQTVPASWGASFSPASLTLASGATGTSTLTVTSVASALGSNGFTATAGNAASGSGSGSGTWVVNCVRVTPLVTLAPASQSGAPGATVQYTATITNRDTACTDGTFTVSAGAPVNWTASADQPTVTLPPQGSTTVTLTVTSAVSAPGGNFTVSVVAGNGSSGQGSGTAGYTVVVPCTRGVPTVVVSPATQNGAPGAALAYTVIVTNTDQSCGASTVTLTPTVPSGWAGNLGSGSVTLASGASTTVSLSVTSDAASPAGSQNFSVLASTPSSGNATSTAAYNVVLTCLRASPLLVLTPASQTGAAGAALSYTATLTNQDSNCANATFAISAAVPSGWTGSPASPQLQLASGATGSVVVTVTSAAAATSGNYSFTVTASSATSGLATATGIDSVATSCVRSAPTLTVAPASQGGAAGSSATYLVTAVNHDVGCSAAQVTLTATAPSGWSAVANPTSLTLGAGASGTSSMLVTSSAGAPPGTFAISVQGATVSSGSGSTSADFVVSAGCTPAAPTVVVRPASQSAIAGATVGYTADVTNNDTGCAASGLAFTLSVPSGWSGLVTLPFAALSAGATSNIDFSITSATSAPTGANSFTFDATRAVGGSGSATGSYQVVPGCVRVAPSISFAPASATAFAGQAKTYVATLTNNDTGCAASTFTLAATPPAAGYTTVFVAPTLTLAPQASGTSTLTVTSPSTGAVGNFTVPVAVTSPGGVAGSGSVVYSVAPNCVRAVPGLTLNPTAASGAAGLTLTFTATIVNQDTACAAGDFAVTSVAPTDFVAQASSGSVHLLPGETGTVTLQVTSPLTATGANTLTVTAQNAASGSSSASATWTVPCVRAKPVLTFAQTALQGPGASVTKFNATLANTDVGCASTDFTLKAQVPAGWSSTLDSANVALAPGVLKVFGLAVAPQATEFSGDYPVTLTATSALHEDAVAEGVVTWTGAKPTTGCTCAAVDPFSVLAMLALGAALVPRRRRPRR